MTRATPDRSMSRQHALLAVVASGLVAVAVGCSATGEDLVPSSPPVVHDSSQVYEVRVREGDFQVKFSLDGWTVDGNGVPLDVPQGYRFVPLVKVDSTVEAGNVIGSLERLPDYFRELETRAEFSAIDSYVLEQEQVRDTYVEAPVSGVLEEREGEWSIRSTGIDVRIDLGSTQLLRLHRMSLVGEVTVDTLRGRRTLGCESIWLVSNIEHAAYCRLPSSAETISGLSARLDVSTELIPDALLVPNPYLGYSADGDSYFVVVESQDIETRIDVDVGATDGVVSVVSGDVIPGMLLILPEHT